MFKVYTGILLEVSSPITGLKRPFGFQEVETAKISRQSTHEGSKVVSPMHWPPLPPRRYPWATVQPKASSQWKINVLENTM
jgi:hypothetical protein